MLQKINLILLLISFVAIILGQQIILANGAKTATFKAYCKQAYFAPSIDSDGDILWFFTTYDGSSNVAPPYDGYGLVNGELKQQSGNSSVFLMDWISPSYTEVYYFGGDLSSWAFYDPDVYGMVSLNISSTDSDGNGVVDWMQKDKSANENFTGYLQVHSHSVQQASVSGSINRTAGSGTGIYDITYSVPGESGTSQGNWVVGYYEGTIVYEENNCQINATTMDAAGEILSASGSTTYTSSNENQITLNNLDLTVNSSLVRINGNSLTRNGNIYSAAVTALDGSPATSWADFQDWYLEITDPNDLDLDGIPDLSDSIYESIIFFETIGTDLGSGWKNLSWFGTYFPTSSGWIYHLQHGWIYLVCDSLDSVWYWHSTHKWCWTNQNIYRWVWFDALQSWNYSSQ